MCVHTVRYAYYVVITWYIIMGCLPVALTFITYMDLYDMLLS